MAEPTFMLVDGHSAIFAIRELRELHSDLPRRARAELLSRMASYVDATGERAVVVFDGRGETSEEERGTPGLQVFYSGSGKTADDIIERLAAKYAERYELTVVTEDQLERTTVEAFGAWTIGVEGLVDKWRRAEGELREKIERLKAR